MSKRRLELPGRRAPDNFVLPTRLRWKAGLPFVTALTKDPSGQVLISVVPVWADRVIERLHRLRSP